MDAKFGAHIHGPHRMNCNNFDPLTFSSSFHTIWYKLDFVLYFSSGTVEPHRELSMEVGSYLILYNHVCFPFGMKMCQSTTLKPRYILNC